MPKNMVNFLKFDKQYIIFPLQSVLSWSLTHKPCHITLQVRTLQSFPITLRIRSKHLTMAYKTLHLWPCLFSCLCYLSRIGLFIVLQTCQAHFYASAFALAFPTAENPFRLDLHKTYSFILFRSVL